MKRYVVGGQNEIVGPWVSARTGGHWTPQRGETLAMVEIDDECTRGEILAGLIYEDWTEDGNIVCHIAAQGRRWMTRYFLWQMFAYPFNQLKVRRITAPITADNHDSIKFVQHLGFRCDAVLSQAARGGRDLLLYVLWKEDCKWLELESRYGPKGTADHGGSSGNGRTDGAEGDGEQLRNAA